MKNNSRIITVDQTEARMEEALMRLERAVLNRGTRAQADTGEQAIYIEQLESENIQMARDLANIKENCAALKTGYEELEGKYTRLAKINDSAERELLATLHDLDQLIAQKSLH